MCMYKYTRVAYCLTDIVVSFIALLLVVVVIVVVAVVVLSKIFVDLFVISVSGFYCIVPLWVTLCQYVCMSLWMCSFLTVWMASYILAVVCVHICRICGQNVYMHLYLSLCAHSLCNLSLSRRGCDCTRAYCVLICAPVHYVLLLYRHVVTICLTVFIFWLGFCLSETYPLPQNTAVGCKYITNPITIMTIQNFS